MQNDELGRDEVSEDSEEEDSMAKDKGFKELTGRSDFRAEYLKVRNSIAVPNLFVIVG